MEMHTEFNTFLLRNDHRSIFYHNVPKPIIIGPIWTNTAEFKKYIKLRETSAAIRDTFYYGKCYKMHRWAFRISKIFSGEKPPEPLSYAAGKGKEEPVRSKSGHDLTP